MICISPENLILHIPKCGGMAVNGAKPSGYMQDSGSWALRDIERRTGRALGTFRRIVAVIRCPYARELSHYEFCKWKGLERGTQHKTLDSFVMDPLAHFPGYYWGQLNDDHQRQGYCPHWPIEDPGAYIEQHGCYRWWVAVGGKIPESVRIVRLERVNEELSEATGHKWKVRKHHVTPYKGTWQEQMGSEARAQVRRMYRWAFENFYHEDGSLR